VWPSEILALRVPGEAAFSPAQCGADRFLRALVGDGAEGVPVRVRLTVPIVGGLYSCALSYMMKMKVFRLLASLKVSPLALNLLLPIEVPRLRVMTKGL
jgi:hypothetical protein